jgi:tetratricopeptide (TPR) repeat protein
VNKDSVQAPFTLKRVQEMLGLSRTTVTGLINAGFVAPIRGPRNEFRFSFQDLMLLRTAFALQQAHIPPRRIVRSLAKLKAELPEELPLTGLRIAAVGADVAVRDRTGQWQADSGQLLMDFEVAEVAGSVHIITAPSSNKSQSPVDWFRRGAALEQSDPVAAEAAYRQAVESDPTCSSPYLNLGALLCEASRCQEAVELYQSAIGVVGHDPLIHFNHAVALDDLARADEAILAYQQVLSLDAAFADAHYNLALLLEKRGDGKGALRHFNAYRRLEGSRQL